MYSFSFLFYIPQSHLFLESRDDLFSERSKIAALALRAGGAPVRFRLVSGWPLGIPHLYPQSRDLVLEITYYVAILRNVIGDVDDVSLDFVRYPVGSVGVYKGVLALVPVNRSRRHVSYHHRSTVSAQSVLQQSRQLRVAVINVTGAAG